MASWLMIYKPGTFWGVFNRHIPKRDMYLLDTYLSIPILDKDGVAQKPLIQKPGTFWGVCCYALPIRSKNWVVSWLMIHKPGTRRGVFNRYIPKRDRYLWDTYLSNPILGEDLIPH